MTADAMTGGHVVPVHHPHCNVACRVNSHWLTGADDAAPHAHDSPAEQCATCLDADS